MSEEILKPTVCLYHPSVWPDHNDSKRRVFKELGHQFIIALLFHLDHKMVRFVCGSGSQEGSVLYSEPVEVEMIMPYPFTFGLYPGCEITIAGHKNMIQYILYTFFIFYAQLF